MPSERFLNLPEEKRQRVLRAAVEEFSRVPFDQVSINKIIQAAGIPRGSFYQYFEDKQDLLEFIMRGYGIGMREAALRALEATGGDIFAAFVRALDYTIELGLRARNKGFFHNVFSCARQADSEHFAFSRMAAAELLEQYRGRVNVGMLRRADDIFLTDMLDVLTALLRQTVARMFAASESADEVRQAFLRKIEIVQRGALQKGGMA